MRQQPIYSFVTNDRVFLITHLIIWVLAFGLFGSILFFGVWSDLHLHIEAVRSFLRGEDGLPTHFLYFALVAILGFGQANMYILSPAAGVLLATAVWAKYIGSSWILASYSSTTNQNRFWWIFLAIVLVFAFNIPGLERYMGGQLPPNVWHNSTTIFLMPFSLALFWFAHLFLTQRETRYLIPMTVFLVLNILIKPSFVLCFAPIFPLFSLVKLGFSRKFFLSMLPLVFTGILLIGEYTLLYILSSTTTQASGIEISFLKDWAAKSNYIIISLLVSIAYPLLFLGLYWKKAIKTNIIPFSWALFLMGLLILMFIVETGPRATHGNFRWQAVVCNYLLFLTSSMLWLKVLHERVGGIRFKNFQLRDWMLLGVLGLHLLSGIMYLIKVFIEKTTLL